MKNARLFLTCLLDSLRYTAYTLLVFGVLGLLICVEYFALEHDWGLWHLLGSVLSMIFGISYYNYREKLKQGEDQ